jgi:hypothetical protein
MGIALANSLPTFVSKRAETPQCAARAPR